MLWNLLAVFIVIWIIISRWKQRKMIALFNQLDPGNIALPFIGHAYLFLGNAERRMNMLKKVGNHAVDRGGVIAHWQGSKLYVFVAEPEAAEVVLKTCLEKDEVMRFSRILLGNGSIFAPVNIWRPRRKIVAPTFSQKNLNTFVDIFARHSSVLATKLKELAGKGASSIWMPMTTYTMDSVCEITLGTQIEVQADVQESFIQAFRDVSRTDAERICQPWQHNDTIYRLIWPHTKKLHTDSVNIIWDFMDKMIAIKWDGIRKQKRQHGSNQIAKDGLKTFLELLIESPVGDKTLSGLELREETLVIVLAGTDSSAVGTGFTTLMVAKHPDVQEKVYEELQEVFGDSDRLVTPEDLVRLKYLDAVIREALRLYPPVPFIVREVLEDVTLPSGITLVKGCGVVLSIWSIHRNHHIWGEDSDQFRPERFFETPPNNPAAFMPFSYGPRSCLGNKYAMMSMKTALVALLRQYRVSLPVGKYKEKELRVKFNVMIKDVHNFEVQLDLRRL